MTPISLAFILDVVDDWPPVAVESLACHQLSNGYQIDTPPLFIKGLSVGDIIRADVNPEGNVQDWVHIEKSAHSTIWLLRTGTVDNADIDAILKQLQGLNCHTISLAEHGCYAIDVPPQCPISEVDACLNTLDSHCIAIAYPSFRHEDH